jgi:hypothetical protein
MVKKETRGRARVHMQGRERTFASRQYFQADQLPVGGCRSQSVYRMNRDIMLACIFEENHVLMLSILEQSRTRLLELCGSNSVGEATITALLSMASQNSVNCLVVFVACLNMDVHMKKLVVQGYPTYKLCGLPPNKAALFFTYLETKVMLPWLMDERVSSKQLISTVKNYYLVA